MIDSALRSAAYDKGVEIRLMMSNWTHIKMEMLPMLRSLQEFGDACKNGNITVVSMLASLTTLKYDLYRDWTDRWF